MRISLFKMVGNFGEPDTQLQRVNGRPIPRNNAVEQKEAAAFWWQQAGGEAASHRKPTQAHSKDQLHHHRDPERGERIGA